MLRKIHYKIAMAAGLCIVVAVVTLALVVVNRNNALQQQVMAMTSQELSQKAENELQKLAEIQAGKVIEPLTQAMEVTRGITNTMKSFLLGQRPELLDRVAFSEYTRDVLVQNPDLMGTYIAWEEGVGDGRDAEFIGTNHTHESGQFAPYWNRSADGNIAIRPLNLTKVYDDEAKGNPGGVSDWYLCPKHKKRDCMVDPYTWEVQGQTVVGTSLVSAILDGNRFIGMTGIDISLGFLQGIAQSGDSNFYNGAGSIFFVAPNNMLGAASDNSELVGKPLPGDRAQIIASAMADGKAQVLSAGDLYYAIAPIVVKGVPERWAAVIEIEKAVVLAGVAKTDQVVTSSFVSTIEVFVLIAALIAVLSVVVMSVLAKGISSPIENTARALAQLASNEGDLTRRTALNRDDEIGDLSKSIDAFLSKTHDIVKDIAGEMDQVNNSVDVSKRLSDNTNKGMQTQREELELVSVAINEMSATAAEVAKSAAMTAESAGSVRDSVHAGNQKVELNLNSIRELVEDMESTGSVIQRLSDDSANISNIVNVINGISEQTNLLALNAAIEAARAGEQGRGFAVVADEVRTLAAKTQESTGEIQSLIDTLQACTNEAVSSIDQGREKSARCIEQAQDAVASLQEVVSSISQVDDMTTQIASAAEEQRSVSEDITRNVNTISDVATDVANGAEESQRESAHMMDSVFALKEQLNRFRY